MEYLIKIPEGGNISLILGLLKELNVQIEPQADTDWFNDLSLEQQADLTTSIKEVDEGTAKFVSNEHVRDRVKQLFEQKKEQK